MNFNPNSFKALFPLFSHPDNKGLVYLDNAATTQKPALVIDAISEFYQRYNANANRSSHRLGQQVTLIQETVRDQAAAFLGAQHSDEIILCSGATEGLNLLAYGLEDQLSPGDEIILSEVEHHANLVPWQQLAKRKQCLLRFISYQDNSLCLQELTSLISDKTKLLCVSAASNALGTVTQMTKIRQIIDDRNIQLIVDAAQLAAHTKINVQSLGCDFLVCSAHKFYGPTGIGLCYGKRERLEKLSVFKTGGEMIDKVCLHKSSFAPPPQRFETGTAALAAIAGLGACFSFWEAQDRNSLRDHEQLLTQHLHQKLIDINGIRLLSQSTNNVGIASFATDSSIKFSAADIAYAMDEQDIAIRCGALCAEPLMHRLGVTSIIRASIAAYNTQEDIDYFYKALSTSVEAASINVAAKQSTIKRLQTRQASYNDYYRDLLAANNWQEKYKSLMNFGNSIEENHNIRSSENLVHGCEAKVWLQHENIVEKTDRENNSTPRTLNRFTIDSDSRVIKGLCAILLHSINNKTSDEIRAIDIDAAFLALGLTKNLSASRVNGFYTLKEQCLSVID